MTEHRRIPGDPRLGFHRDDLEGEVCLDCGEPAEVCIEDADGLSHYCGECDEARANATWRATGEGTVSHEAQR